MLGALLGAGSSIVGGFLQNRAQKRNIKLQKEFAQKGIQWKVNDAKKAGVSPLFALGANTHSYSPVSVGGSDYGIPQAGQDIGRAISATQTGPQRTTSIQRMAQTEQIEGLKIDNDIKRVDLASKVARLQQPGTPPAHPGGHPYAGIPDTVPHIPGQGDNPTTKIDYKTRIAPASETARHASYGIRPEVDYYRTATGSYSPEVPVDLGEAHESQPLAAAAWFIRNRLSPAFSSAHDAPPFPAPKGKYWDYSVLHGYSLKPRPNNHYKMRIPRAKPRRR